MIQASISESIRSDSSKGATVLNVLQVLEGTKFGAQLELGKTQELDRYPTWYLSMGAFKLDCRTAKEVKMLKCYSVQEKFRIAAKAAGEKGLIVDTDGRPKPATPVNLVQAIARQGGQISYPVLKNRWNDHHILQSHVDAVADFFGFAPDDVRFCDPSSTSQQHQMPEVLYPGRDSLSAFTAMVRTVLRLNLPKTQLQSLQQEMSRLSLISFDVAGGQAVIDGTPHEGYLSIRFDKGAYEHFEYGVAKARLRIIPEKESNAKFEAVLGAPTATEMDGLLVRDVGLRNVPEWDLSSRGSSLEGRFVFERPLFRVFDTYRGYRVRIEIAIQPARASLHFSEAAPAEAKQAVIRSILAESMPGVRDASGWVTLGWQVLAVTDAREGPVRYINDEFVVGGGE